MWFRLAKDVTHTSVEETKRLVTWHEFMQWVAFYEIEHRQVGKDDFRFAQLNETINRSMGGKCKMKQFLLKWEPEKSNKNNDVAAQLIAFAHDYNKSRGYE